MGSESYYVASLTVVCYRMLENHMGECALRNASTLGCGPACIVAFHKVSMLVVHTGLGLGLKKEYLVFLYLALLGSSLPEPSQSYVTGTFYVD